MSFNLRNRSLLTVQDYTQREFRYLLDLARDLKRAKYAQNRTAAPRRQRNLSDFRKDIDAHAVRVRNRVLRPGRQRHVSRSRGLADRSQGIVQGHRARAGPHVRCDRVSRRVADRRRNTRKVCGRAGVQRPDGRISPDADAGGRADDARELRQADHRRSSTPMSATRARTWGTR